MYEIYIYQLYEILDEGFFSMILSKCQQTAMDCGIVPFT